jgi:F0F1-type ATP synthase membrane subunit b/b'
MTQFESPRGGPPNVPAETDPAKITQMEADIGQTRDAISGDLRALGERLSPEQLKEDARDVMTEAKNAAKETLQEAKNVATATFREVKDSAMDTMSAKVDEFKGNVRNAEREAFGFVRANAVPLALMGIGLTWFMSNRRAKASRWDGQYAPRGDGRWRYPSDNDRRDKGSRPMDAARDGVSRASAAAGDLAHRAKDQAQTWADDAKHEVSDVAGQVQGMARDAGHKLSEAAGNARDVAGRELEHAREFSRRTTEAHPLAVGAAALATGVCVGLLIPETRRESALFGAQRDRLMGEAKEAARDWKDTAQHTARDVKTSLSDSLG